MHVLKSIELNKKKLYCMLIQNEIENKNNYQMYSFNSFFT